MRKKLISFSICILFLVSAVTVNFPNNLLVSKAVGSYEPWHFIALGDTRNWWPDDTNILREVILDDVFISNPNLEFILHTGDMTNNGGEQRDWDLYYEDIDLHVENNVTFYYTVGNHETYTYPLPDGSYGPPELNFSTYMANVEMPGNERYYSFDHKGIHFIFINTDEYWIHEGAYEFDITTEQKDWIINDLASNTMNFTIASFHRPCYSVRSESRYLQANVIRKVLEPILIEFGVDLVFSGHDHYYYNTKRKGIQHIVTGGAGAPLADTGFTGHALVADRYFSKYHYCNVTVTEEVITIDAHAYYEESGNKSIDDTITMYLKEPSKTRISYFFGFTVVLFWVIPHLRKKIKK